MNYAKTLVSLVDSGCVGDNKLRQIFYKIIIILLTRYYFDEMTRTKTKAWCRGSVEEDAPLCFEYKHVTSSIYKYMCMYE